MDNGRKLRRYTRKDYTQLVDFPVEIVDRDGLVRRYSFEESVQLYQRRIASANLRYTDTEVVKAEVRHCEQRIRQLRKSYFTRFGWSAARVVDSPGMAAGDFAGEVVAFLRRVVDVDPPEDSDLELAFVADEDHRQLYYVRRPEQSGDDRRWLLYLYRFEGPGASPAREAFFGFLKVLQGVRGAGDGVEHIAGFHHSADCGLVLTGSEVAAREPDSPLDGDAPADGIADADGGEPRGAPPPWMELVEVRDDPLRQGMVLLRKGRRADALRCFAAAYEQNHYRRAGYVGAVVVADQLGEHAEAETAALMGSRYFRRDALMHYHLAVARLRLGDPRAADAAATMRELAGETFAASLLDALVALRAGDVDAGRRHLQRGRALAGEDDADLAGAARVVRAQLAARDLTRLTGAGLIAAGLVLALAGTLPAIGLSVAGAALVPGAHALWRRQFSRLLEQPGADGIRLANPTALRHLRAATRAQ
jgi:hypothetical protein